MSIYTSLKVERKRDMCANLVHCDTGVGVPPVPNANNTHTAKYFNFMTNMTWRSVQDWGSANKL